MLHLLLCVSAIFTLLATAVQAADAPMPPAYRQVPVITEPLPQATEPLPPASQPIHITRERPVEESDINYGNFEAAGFGGIATLLQAMSPEQRKLVLEMAAQRQKELEAMTPEERHQVELQLHQTYDTIGTQTDFKTIDPNKLDVSKAKDLRGITQDMKTYRKQTIEQGKQ